MRQDKDRAYVCPSCGECYWFQEQAEDCARLDNKGCKHPKTRNLYDQRPPSEGRKLKAVRRLCESCGAVLPFTIEVQSGQTEKRFEPFSPEAEVKPDA